MSAVAQRLLERVRTYALALPDTNERASHGMPTFWIADKKTFASFADHHHRAAFVALWAAAPPGAQQALVASDPDTFFLPPYVAHRGWIGVYLHAKTRWTTVRDVLVDAHESVAAGMPARRRTP